MSYSWFGLVNVDYSHGTNFKSVPSQLYILLTHRSVLAITTDQHLLYVLVHSLTHQDTSSYSDLQCWGNDKLYSMEDLVSFNNRVSNQHILLHV